MSLIKHTVQGEGCELSASLDAIASIREAWLQFLTQQNVSADQVTGWELVFTECLVNAVIHGADKDPACSIKVTWWVQDDWICLKVEDPGKGIASQGSKDFQLPKNALEEHGRGLFIIHEFCDEWEHWVGPHGYCQILKKRYKTSTVYEFIDPLLEQALNEISLCYESLSAFYRLGESLIRAEKVSDFIQEALVDLMSLLACNNLGITFDLEKLNAQLELEFLQKDFSSQFLLEKSPTLQNLLNNGGEFAWESPADVAQDPELITSDSGMARVIQVAGVNLGIMVATRKSKVGFFSAAELNTLRTFGDLFGIAIAQSNNAIARQTEQQALHELQIAAELQERLFPVPNLPINPQWNLFVQRKSARHIGGDYVDAIFSPQGDLVMVMVDVMGKGVSASFLAAMIRTSLRINLDLGKNLQELIQAVNQILCDQLSDLTMFATCAIAWFSPAKKMLEFVNAGHCPILLSRGGQLEQISPSGPPLGLFEDSAYTIEKRPVSGSEAVLLVTDGAYEWPIEQVPWGWEAWMQFISENQRLHNPQKLWNDLQEKINKNSDSEEPTDDEALLHWSINYA